MSQVRTYLLQRIFRKQALRLLTTKKKPSNIRNIGIIAHIDSGKTTITEKFLYLAGMIKSVGNVDSGTTVTDYLDIERERGITVQSAVVHFDWHGHKINLIDTPGHVDFTMEVERSLRVMDGVVVVLDGSVGVQAQTLTVYNQASKFNLPSVFFLNKMDKKGADEKKAIDSIEQKLGVKTILTSSLVRDGGKVTGIVDLLKKSWLDVTSESPRWIAIDKNTRIEEAYLRGHEEMLYSLADCDKEFSDEFLDNNFQNIKANTIYEAILRVTLKRMGSAVSCGSALRWNASVSTALDAVASFLPNPEEELNLSEYFEDQLSALVFKVTHDKRKGPLSYLRVYTGSLKNNATIFNATRGQNEGPAKVFLPYSDELTSVDVITAGNIAVVSGLKKTITGDTLLATDLLGYEAAKKHHTNRKISQTISHDSHRKQAHNVGLHRLSVVKNVKSDKNVLTMTGIETPEPVYYCSVEPPSTSSQHEFEKALSELCVEDPSMRFRVSQETGQMIIEAMGELHLEVIKDRFLTNYGLKVFLGPLQIAYREVILNAASRSTSVEETLNGRIHAASLNLSISPSDAKFKQVSLNLPKDPPPLPPRAEWIQAINEGCMNALQNGPLLGFPISNVSISLDGYTVSGGKINTALISACANRCVSEALDESGVRLAEPVMKLDITVQNLDSSTPGLQPILQELSKRRTQISGVTPIGNSTTISGIIPLAEMPDLASTIRTLSSGYASLHVQVHDYQMLNEHDQEKIIRTSVRRN